MNRAVAAGLALTALLRSCAAEGDTTRASGPGNVKRDVVLQADWFGSHWMDFRYTVAGKKSPTIQKKNSFTQTVRAEPGQAVAMFLETARGEQPPPDAVRCRILVGGVVVKETEGKGGCGADVTVPAPDPQAAS